MNLEIIIPSDEPVRLLSAVAEELDYSRLTATYSRSEKIEHSPRLLFKIVLYGCTRGIYATREIERACRENVNFMYLLEGHRAPDHNTIARFRRDHLPYAVEDLLNQMVRLLVRCGEISFEESAVFIDGTKIEANANRYSFVCSAQDAPYPPEKAKFVLRKSEQTAFPEKKTPLIEPAKNEKAAAPMPPVPVEPPAVQSVPEKPASFKVEPLPEAPTFTLPLLPEQDGPKKPKRRISWGWLAAGVAAVAFFVFALPPLKRTAEANRQMIIAQQAVEQEKRKQEEQRAEQTRLEEEAAAQRWREEKQARIEALQNADLPYPGMPHEELTSTKLGRASKVTREMRSGQVCYTFVWQIRVGDYLYPIFVATTENEEVLTAEQRNLEYWSDMALKGTIYHQPEYKPSTPSQNQTGGTNHGSNGLRDEYDNPEDLYEDNPDWFEDEDEAWDEWEDG